MSVLQRAFCLRHGQNSEVMELFLKHDRSLIKPVIYYDGA